ncbi:hypothetical protein F5148DRAFT_1145527 [Russula earlei]|uniref:Uncharacterized protein n=1 Tax=Russula earlei TaxID=71964 RepID=A0ACC0UNC7_9AGAM|nr:hypothetical protein F5148DRAFT_1145527 [Russula earlei]
MSLKSPDSFMFTVGKLDAGMAILLGERAHLIEFPSLLLPPGATTGSIVNISVTQNVAEEHKRDRDFWELQAEILDEFGQRTPNAPQISLRNATQTSVTLEWPPLELATASLRSLDIYKNGQRLAAIPSPLMNTSTKLSGLDINTDYSFRLVMRTTAGIFQSNLIRVRTHTMTDTSGISVCFGNVQDSGLLENAKLALQEMHAKWSDKIQIDTTHFVCTSPAATPTGSQTSGSISSAPGVEYQRALQLSIPIVQPQWILSCYAEKKMVPISAFYLGTTQSTPTSSAQFNRPQSMSQVSLPQSTQATKATNRASMPAPSRSSTSPDPSHPTSSESSLKAARRTFEPTPEESGDGNEPQDAAPQTRPVRNRGPPRARHGTMDREFKFPPAAGSLESDNDSHGAGRTGDTFRAPNEGLTTVDKVAPSNPSVEVPPPPIEKERPSTIHDDGDEDVGETEEISLN